MTHAIGSVIKYGGCNYVVVKDKSGEVKDGCGKCVLFGRRCADLAGVFGDCADSLRTDRESVHFEQYGVDW